MERPVSDSGALNSAKCMICGRIHETGVYEDSSGIQQPQVERGFCYLIYKRLLGIYGASFITILNSC